MLSILVKARLASLFGSMFRGSRGTKRRSPLIKVLAGLLILFAVAQFLGLSGLMFDAVFPSLHGAGLSWLYFALAGIMAFGLIFVGSVLMTQSQLFEAKDNEQLLSMPIPPRLILMSRMLVLLAMNYLFEALIVIPAGVVFALHAPVSAAGVLLFIIAFLFLPLPAMALSGLFGWLLSLISSRMRNKSLIVTLLSIGFLLLYMYVFSGLNNYMGYLIQNGSTIARAVEQTMPPAYHLGLAIAEKNFRSLLFFLLFCVVPFGLVYAVLSANFIRIATAKPGAAKAVYRARPLKAGSAMAALVKKELRHFFSSPMYILNASMGIIFTCILPVAMLFNRDLLATLFAEDFPGIANLTGPFTLLVLCVLTTTNVISAPSISLEGKRLWIAQSLPVSGGDVLLSKAMAHMLLCLPSVFFAAIMLSFILEVGTLMHVLLFLAPAILTVFGALFGVAVNLHFPKFDWMSETVAVKQGMSTIVTMFGSMALVALTVVLYVVLLDNILRLEIYILLVSLLLAALCAGLFFFLRTKGSRMFAALSA